MNDKSFFCAMFTGMVTGMVIAVACFAFATWLVAIQPHVIVETHLGEARIEGDGQQVIMEAVNKHYPAVRQFSVIVHDKDGRTVRMRPEDYERGSE